METRGDYVLPRLLEGYLVPLKFTSSYVFLLHTVSSSQVLHTSSPQCQIPTLRQDL